MATYSAYKYNGSTLMYRLDFIVNEILPLSSADIANNVSRVNWELKLYSFNNYSFSSHTLYWYIAIGGQEIEANGYLYPAKINAYSSITIDSGTATISHKTDGSKLAYCYAKLSTSSGSYMPEMMEATGNLQLTKVPRTSGVSCNSFNIGDATTIVISSADASLRHTLTWHFGNNSGTIATKTSATTIGYTIPASSLYSQIPSAQVGAGTITCHTYSGDTLIGTSTCGFNAYAKEAECKPSVSVSVVDINDTTIALTGSNQKLIKGFSTALVSVSATPKNSSSITGYYISTGDGRVSYASSASFANIGANSFYGQASDSRGYATGVSVSKTWIDYVYLAFTKIEIKRPESTADEATMTIQGNYWNGNFGNKNNSLTLQYRYKENGGEYSEWTSLTPTISGNTFSYAQLLENLDHNTEYIFQFMIDDELMTVYSKEQDGVLTKGIPVLRVGKDYVKVNGNIPLTDHKYYRGSCNDIVETCVVYVSGGTDCPEELNGVNYGFLFTKAINENYISQTFEDANSNRIWKRFKTTSGWRAWEKQVIIKDVEWLDPVLTKHNDRYYDYDISRARAIIVYFTFHGEHYRDNVIISNPDTQWFMVNNYQGLIGYVFIDWAGGNLVCSQLADENFKIIGYRLLM